SDPLGRALRGGADRGRLGHGLLLGRLRERGRGAAGAAGGAGDPARRPAAPGEAGRHQDPAGARPDHPPSVDAAGILHPFHRGLHRAHVLHDVGVSVSHRGGGAQPARGLGGDDRAGGGRRGGRTADRGADPAPPAAAFHARAAHRGGDRGAAAGARAVARARPDVVADRAGLRLLDRRAGQQHRDRKSTRLNSSHVSISSARSRRRLPYTTLFRSVAVVGGPLIGALTQRHPLRRSTLVLLIVAVIGVPLLALVLWPGPAPMWLLIVLVSGFSIGGPGSNI